MSEPTDPKTRKPIARRSSDADVDAFLRKVNDTPPVASHGERGRLMFAMDATASREPTWDQACQIQAEMFEETASLGGLDVQLVHYRGFREFHVGPWLGDAASLQKRMTAVTCAGGLTQIGRVLDHALAETGRARVDALVLVGDCMEEDIDAICDKAGRLGLLGVPVFAFHEGDEPAAVRTFSEIARLTRGACCRFDPGSPGQLKALLGAVAVYAAGGRRALARLGADRGGVVALLSHQVGEG